MDDRPIPLVLVVSMDICDNCGYEWKEADIHYCGGCDQGLCPMCMAEHPVDCDDYEDW